jgi:DNA-binding transcriptional ArsR family regulator
VLGSLNEIEAFQAALLRTLASPQRLRIVHLLGDRPREVHELAAELGLGQSSISQHLAAMRNIGLLDAIRTGRTVEYRLADPEIRVACDLMRDVLVRRISALADLAAASRLGDPPGDRQVPVAAAPSPTAAGR